MKVLLTNLLYVVIIAASIDVLVLKECFGVPIMVILTHLTAHGLALVACKNDLLIGMHRAIRLLAALYLLLLSLELIEISLSLLYLDDLALDLEQLLHTSILYV